MFFFFQNISQKWKENDIVKNSTVLHLIVIIHSDVYLKVADDRHDVQIFILIWNPVRAFKTNQTSSYFDI